MAERLAVALAIPQSERGNFVQLARTALLADQSPPLPVPRPVPAEIGRREKWQFQTKGIVKTPAIAGEVLYVGSSDGNLYAVDAQTGQEKWRFKATPFSDMGWPIIADGVVYISSTDGYLYAIQ